MDSETPPATPVTETPRPLPPVMTTPGGRSVDLAEATVRIAVAGGDYAEPFEAEIGPFQFTSTGTGFIIDPSGLAVTNYHVVGSASTIEVALGEPQRQVSAEIVGLSECNDLAVIDLAGDGYQYFDWYTGPIERGMLVQSVGFPLSTPQLTQTQGIIAKTEAPEDTRWSSIAAVFDHDARINGGNSGGPLILASEPVVVGVNYAGSNETDVNTAISVSVARPLSDILRTGQNVDSVGINPLSILTPEGLSGVGVRSVRPGSAADRAGLQAGDIITAVAELPPAPDGSMGNFCQIVRTQGQDGVIPIVVQRRLTNEILEGQINGAPLAVTGTVPVAPPPMTPVTPEEPPPPPPVTEPTETCSDTCAIPSQVANGFCNDGSNGDLALCDPGTDCTDCGEGPDGCADTCTVSAASADGACDDGGPDSDFDICELGTDCTDCGDRATP
jgi:serine protease Do